MLVQVQPGVLCAGSSTSRATYKIVICHGVLSLRLTARIIVRATPLDIIKTLYSNQLTLYGLGGAKSPLFGSIPQDEVCFLGDLG